MGTGSSMSLSQQDTRIVKLHVDRRIYDLNTFHFGTEFPKNVQFQFKINFLCSIEVFLHKALSQGNLYTALVNKIASVHKTFGVIFTSLFVIVFTLKSSTHVTMIA